MSRAQGAAQPGGHSAAVLVYIAFALIALLPGLIGMAKLPVTEGTLIGALYRDAMERLQDIRFGSGLRFWLGVTGATMMGLLLLYPLRKAFARGRMVGSVGAWFHIHMLMGLFGPVLILYHCNFSLGALNANVALWTMLVVAISGIIGHFVYARVSAGFYGGKRQARDLLDTFIAAVRALDGQHVARQSLIDRLERFEAHMLAPRRGVYASAAARWHGAVHRRQFHRDLSALTITVAREQRWPLDRANQCRRHLHDLLKQYMDCVRAAAGRSVLEQLWSRWRLFHLPVFLVMSVAVILHVMAVWGLDAPGSADEAAHAIGITAGMSDAAAKPDQIAQILAAPVPHVSTAKAARVAGSPVAPPSALLPAAPVVTPSPVVDVEARLLIKPHEISGPPAAVKPPLQPAVKPAAATLEPPQQSAMPLPVTPRPAARLVAKPAAKSAPAPDAVVAREIDPRPATLVESRPPASVKPAVPAGIEATYAELRQRQDEPPMGLGATKRVLSLSERIAELKSQRFDHGKTKFPLTGKHLKNECGDCHKTKLENTPRECVACHKQDDVHNGRRTDCARCHTTNRWTQIIRR